jgi:hypothetical protein
LASIIPQVFIDFHNFKNHKSKTCVEAYKTLPFCIFSQFGHFCLDAFWKRAFLLFVDPQKTLNSQQSSQLGCFFFGFSEFHPAFLEIIVIVYFVVCLLVMNEQTAEYDKISQ